MDKVAKVFKKYGIDEAYKAPTILMNILFDKEKREQLFKDMMKAHDYDMSYDWFFEYFQDEHADRKKKKQDFTPRTVSDLMSKLVSNGQGDDGNYYEPCAGTGGIAIVHWHNHRKQYSIFNYEPCLHFATLEEWSDRAIPFLLFNCMIRGMNAVVVHVDVITRKSKGAYLVSNNNNDYMNFSNLSVFPHTEAIAKELGVYEWLNEPIREHLELMSLEMIGNLVSR